MTETTSPAKVMELALQRPTVAGTKPRVSGALAANRKLQKLGIGDLLSVVLALSARTRRVVQPRVTIDLDVFAPGGRRAVRMVMRPLP
jgi:hypothetical protein